MESMSSPTPYPSLWLMLRTRSSLTIRALRLPTGNRSAVATAWWNIRTRGIEVALVLIAEIARKTGRLLIEQGSRLERKDKPGIPCAHLFTGSGYTATEVLLFFPRGADPIQVADKLVTLEIRFAPFHLS